MAELEEKKTLAFLLSFAKKPFRDFTVVKNVLFKSTLASFKPALISEFAANSQR